MKYIWFFIFLLLSIEKPPKIYLPIIIYNNRIPIEVYDEYVTENTLSYTVSSTGSGISWDKVESIKGSYNWSDYDQFFLLDNFSLRITHSPHWARLQSDYVCSPPREIYYQDFVDFTVALIERYRPYGIQIWNEPDVDIPLSYPEFMGCWGTGYQDGVRYGEFVNYVYPKVKEKYPNVEILAGELNEVSKFAEGFLDTVDMIDGISYHSYSHYPWKNYHLALNKYNQLKSLTDFPIYLNETAYVCDSNCGSEFEQQQVEYLQYLIDNVPVKRIRWYTICCNGWRSSDMVYRGIKRPVWYIYANLP